MTQKKKNVLNKRWIKFQFINNLYRLVGVMIRVPASSAVDRGFESCHVKPEIMTLVFAVSPARGIKDRQKLVDMESG